jgi:hypothetical protein
MPQIVLYAVAGMLALGAAPLPYGYYTFLRLVACATFVFAAYVLFTKKAKALPFVFAALAVLFNPIIKVHLPKEVWAGVDVVCAVFLAATAHLIAKRGSGAA